MENGFFTSVISVLIHSGCCIYQRFFSFYCCVAFHGMEVPQFNHSLAKGHLSYFHFLDIMSQAAINIHVQILLRTQYSFHFCGRNAQEYNYWVIYLLFKETVCFSEWLFYILTSNIRMIWFLCILASISYCHDFFFLAKLSM